MSRGGGVYGAFHKGMGAALAGESLEDCPYRDKRKANGRLTFSRAFINAWRDGFEHAKKNREQALITQQYKCHPGCVCGWKRGERP